MTPDRFAQMAKREMNLSQGINSIRDLLEPPKETREPT